MRIAVLVYRLNGIGGIAKHVLLMSRELVELGHEVDIWAVEHDPVHCYPELSRGLNICSLRTPEALSGDLYRTPAGSRMLIYLAQLWKAYTDQQQLFAALPNGYEIVNPHGDYVHWAAAAYKKRYGAAAVWMCNDFWPAVGAETDSEAGWVGSFKHLAKQPFIYSFERHDRRAVHYLDEIVVLSARVQAQMKQHYSVSTTVVRTGIAAPQINLSGARSHENDTLRDETFHLLTLCTLMPRRRIEDVFAALHLLIAEGIKVDYTIVGRTDHTPSYTNFLHSEVTRLQLEDYVTFTGEVPDKDIGNYVQACDAFVWAADEGQSWGMACMEAMASGKPALVSKANGLAEVLNDGENALLFASGNSQALASAIKRLAQDRCLRAKIAEQGQSLVREQYSWQRNAEAMLELFSEARHRQTPEAEEFPVETAD